MTDKMKVVFISGPYRPTKERAVLENVRQAEKYAIKYWELGYAVICPHLNTAFFDGLADDQIWLKGYLEVLSRCDIVVFIPHWEDSQGSLEELHKARMLGLEIIFEA